jgi:hypothetical protein
MKTAKQMIYEKYQVSGCEIERLELPLNQIIELMQGFADQEVRRAIEKRTPTDDEMTKGYVENKFCTCWANGAKWARDFVREEKPNNLKYDWITECPECKKKYDANDIIFGHRCKPTEIPCSKPSRYIVAITFKFNDIKGYFVNLFDILATDKLNAEQKALTELYKIPGREACNASIMSVSALKL